VWLQEDCKLQHRHTGFVATGLLSLDCTAEPVFGILCTCRMFSWSGLSDHPAALRALLRTNVGSAVRPHMRWHRAHSTVLCERFSAKISALSGIREWALHRIVAQCMVYGASPKNDRIWETLTASHNSSQQLTAQNLKLLWSSLPPTEPSRSPQHAILFQSTVTARSQHAATCCGTCSDPIILWRRAISIQKSLPNRPTIGLRLIR